MAEHCGQGNRSLVEKGGDHIFSDQQSQIDRVSIAISQEK